MILALQRTAGNTAASRMLSHGPGPPLLVQRGGDPPEKGAKPKYALLGQLTFFDAGGARLSGWNVNLDEATMTGGRPAVGVYETTVTPLGAKGSYKLQFGTFTAGVRVSRPAGVPAMLKKHRRAVLAVSGSRGLRSDPEDAEKGAPKEPGGKAGGTGTRTGPGSKYGWLGWLELPQDVIDALEAAFEAFGNGAEYLALKETLEALAELASNADALRALLDPDKLVLAILGLESNPALDALAAWAEAADKGAGKRAGPAPKSGLLRLANRVTQLLAKTRRVVRPVFAARTAFTGVLGRVAAGLQTLTLVNELVEAAQNPRRREEEFALLLEGFSEEAGATIKEQLAAVRATVELHVEKFDQSDLLTSEEIATAVTDAATKAIRQPYKSVVEVSRTLGLIDLVADNVVAPLIPKSALDAINGVLGEVTGSLAPTVKQARKDLDAVIDASEVAVREQLVPQLRSALVMRLTPAEAEQYHGSGTSFFPPARRLAPPPIRQQPALRLESHPAGHPHPAGLPYPPSHSNPPGHSNSSKRPHPGTPLTVQGDWKGAVTALKRKVGDIAVDVLSGLVRPKSRKTAAQVEGLLKKVTKLIGKQVTPDGRPTLPPEAYAYIRDKKGVIVRIRRRPEWAGSHVPKLKIESGRIAIGTAWDWKSAARKKLRAALGKPVNSTDQAHHVIPLELSRHRVVTLATASGWNLNGPENGYYLPVAVHRTKHDRYTEDVRAGLTAIEDAVGAKDWAAVRPRLEALLSKLRARLKRHRLTKKPLD